MISPQAFLDFLASKDITFFSGVPCSYFKDVIRAIRDRQGMRYVIVPNEGSALALAAGSELGGRPSAVMIQNSGLGNLINPLTSLNAIYGLPVLLLVSGRAYGIPDEPQHEIMGRSMGGLLDAIGIRHWDLPQEEDPFAAALEEGLRQMHEKKQPVVFFVRKGTFSAHASPKAETRYPMKRIEAITLIRDHLEPDDLVFVTTGKPSREFFSVGDRPGNFYMQGSMGHIGAVALGTALARPERRVIVVDGDGAFLMHMGMASTLGHYRPKNLYHVVIDNESYETTGDQDTTSPSTDMEAVAMACGYRATGRAEDAAGLKKQLEALRAQPGPVFLRVKVNREETKDIPRITTRYKAPEITEQFKAFSAPSRKR